MKFYNQMIEIKIFCYHKQGIPKTTYSIRGIVNEIIINSMNKLCIKRQLRSYYQTQYMHLKEKLMN